MPYCLLTADHRYGRSRQLPRRRRRGEVGLLRDNNIWARQVDLRDGSPGGPHRRERIAYPRGGLGIQTALRETVRGYERAAQMAERGGTVGVLVGHGSSGETSSGARTATFADLAPGRFLRVTSHQLRILGQALQEPTPSLSPEQQALVDIGRVLREAGVRRVDLLTCSLGMGHGPNFLGLLGRRWGVTVWGLDGYLSSERDANGVEMNVVIYRQPNNVSGPTQVVVGGPYRDRLPRTRWVRGRAPMGPP